MTAAHPPNATGDARRNKEGSGAALLTADWLRLAATPTFGTMALLTGTLVSSHSDMLCSIAGHASPLTGMTVMYALMCAFHLPPWLKLISDRGEACRQRRL